MSNHDYPDDTIIRFGNKTSIRISLKKFIDSLSGIIKII